MGAQHLRDKLTHGRTIGSELEADEKHAHLGESGPELVDGLIVSAECLHIYMDTLYIWYQNSRNGARLRLGKLELPVA